MNGVENFLTKFMKKITLILEKFGLSDKEIAVYLALLRLGPSPVRQIASEAKINRGTTYDILKSLKDQGLVSYYHKATHQYFVAEDPNKLYEVLKNKINNFKQLHEELSEIVPQLRSMSTNVEEKPVVTYYDGLQGVRTILQDVLDKVSESNDLSYEVYSSASIRQYLYASFPEFSEERVKRNIKVKVMALGAGGELIGLDERKWLSKDSNGAPTYTIIYAGRVAMISTNPKSIPMGLIIVDIGLHQAQKIIFDKLWEKL